MSRTINNVSDVMRLRRSPERFGNLPEIAREAIDLLIAEHDRLATYILDSGEAEWCWGDCGALILDGESAGQLASEHDEDDHGPACASCYDYAIATAEVRDDR